MVIKKWWNKNLALVTGIGILLFISAGTIQWLQAWLYVFISLSFIIVTRHVLHPELLSVRSMLHDGTKKWDLVTAPLVTHIGPLTLCITAGLDQRFGWSKIAPMIQVIGLFFMLLGALLIFWTMKSNKYYSQTVRFQYERHHVIVTNGPYKFVRHPGYAGNIMIAFASPMVLGSWVALIPSLFLVCIYIVRTVLEDVTLQRQFKGYYNYAKIVTYRLFPWIW